MSGEHASSSGGDMPARYPRYRPSLPAAGAVPLPAARHVALRHAGMLVLLVAVTFGQRLCFPFGSFQIPLSVPAAYFAAFLFLLSGEGRFGAASLMLYALSVAGLITTLFFDKAYISPFSLFYLIGLYAVYVVSVDLPREEWLRYLRIYQTLMVVLAVIALLQFAGQFAGVDTAWSLFAKLPQRFVLAGYNTRPTLSYGSTFLKANAEFFLEPSFVSQYMAVAIILELLFFSNWKRMVLYGAAIFASFSGTGMLLLALFAVVSAVKARRYELFYALPVLLVFVWIFRDNPYVAAITGRVGEFEYNQSSAAMRFIGPNQILFSVLGTDFSTFLVGKGPGAVDRLVELRVGIESNYPAIHKLLLEYGVIGTLPFLGFLLHAFFAGARSRILAAALFMMYAILSGSLLQPHTIYLFYALSIALPARPVERLRAHTPAFPAAPPPSSYYPARA
ncbi:MAG TPA: hypothetical protein VGD08_00385 [Stellaceae bacterium]